MAEKNTPTAKVPAAKPAAPAAPTAPAVEPKAKRQKATYQETFPSLDEAVKAANERTKGPRRAFTVKSPSGKELYVVAHNEGRALGVAAKSDGYTVEEAGKAKKAKLMGPDAIMAVVNSLPADQQELLKAAIANLGKK